jgi:hypothetical protein
MKTLTAMSQLFKNLKKRKKELAAPGFDPGTSGL